jgi:hypothetical protein
VLGAPEWCVCRQPSGGERRHVFWAAAGVGQQKICAATEAAWGVEAQDLLAHWADRSVVVTLPALGTKFVVIYATLAVLYMCPPRKVVSPTRKAFLAFLSQRFPEHLGDHAEQ